jgi:hypothetical protein
MARRMKRKQFAASAAVATPVADFGPDIRRRDVAIPARTRTVAGEVVVVEPGYTREADTLVTQRPDPARPDRQQDIDVAVRWLPHRLYASGKMTKRQLGAAQWYRDLIDTGEGVVDSQQPGGRGGTMPSRRSLVTDRMVQARADLQDASVAMGVNDATLLKCAVTALSATEVALAIGIAAFRVPAECARVFELLDEWRTRYGRGR